MKATSKKERAEVILEEVQSNVRLILEHTSELRSLPPRVEKIEKDLELLKDDVAAIKVGQRGLQNDMNTVKSDVKEIKKELETKVNRDEFNDPKHRVLRST